MAWSEPPCKAPVLPRIIATVEVRVVPSAIVTYPIVVAYIDVGYFWMALPFSLKVTILLIWPYLFLPCRSLPGLILPWLFLPWLILGLTPLILTCRSLHGRRLRTPLRNVPAPNLGTRPSSILMSSILRKSDCG